MRIVTTENPQHGFHGEMRAAGLNADDAFDLAARQIARTVTVDPLTAAGFLDSRMGRHFADDVCSYLAAGSDLPRALHQAIGRWLSWNIGPSTAAATGIPEGEPYLLGLLIQREIEAESALPL